MTWFPHVTVAAVVENGGRFLLVEEETDEGVRINQPAGHWEEGESLAMGAVREALEETGFRIEPDYLVGVYSWRHPARGMTYLRFAFAAKAIAHDSSRALDTGILRALWMTRAELQASQDRHRSPLVMACVDHYLAGRRVPLEHLHHRA